MLWVLPPPTKSAWFAKIDWYLNWQMCKGLAHEPRRLSHEMLRLIEENELPLSEPPQDNHAPLMIIAHGRLPASKCVVIEYGKSLKTWLTRVHQLAEHLNTDQLRVFLPYDSTRTEAEQIWRSFPAPSVKMNIEFSPNEDATQWPNQFPKN